MSLAHFIVQQIAECLSQKLPPLFICHTSIISTIELFQNHSLETAVRTAVRAAREDHKLAW